MPRIVKQEHSISLSKAKKQTLKLVLGPSRDVPVLYSTHAIVNYTGSEFIVTILAAVQDPVLETPVTPLKTIEAKILGRFSFSIIQWVATGHAIMQQITRLQNDGAFELTGIQEESEGTP